MKILAIGILAGALTTIAFLPQVMRIFKTKHTKDLSLITFSIFTIGVFLWFVYGLLLKEIPIIVANGITFILSTVIVVMKIRYR